MNEILETAIETAVEAPKKSEKKNDFLPFIIATLAIVLPIRLFVAQPFIVNGASMVPTFQNGDYLIVDELTYRFREPKMDEVIVFRYPKDTSKFFIKRIAALPGDTVDGQEMGPEEYFVLGDNRDASSDSRIWGPVDRKYIIGRPLARLLPIKEADLLPGTGERPDVTN